MQTALTSRVVIEQAKGILACHGGAGWDVDTAFAKLRFYSQNHHHKLSDLAAEVVAGRIDLDAVLDL